MRRWTIILLGAFLFQAQAQVPDVPACTKDGGCCTMGGLPNGKNKEECTQYCHRIFDPMATQGTHKDQVAATDNTNSAIVRLAQCKDTCVHNCRG